MENTSKPNLTAEEKAAQEVDTTTDNNSKNSGSSQVDIKRHQTENNYGRTTDTTGVGHEPGTTPGVGI